MTFLEFRNAITDWFDTLQSGEEVLFEMEVDKYELYNLYLDSFPTGTNNILIKRREYDCSACRNFIRNIGNVVAIRDGEIYTIWDADIDDPKYGPVVKALSEFVKSKPVRSMFLSSFRSVGVKQNHSRSEDGTINTFNHLYVKLPKRFVFNNQYYSKDSKIGDFNTTRNVFKRSLDEITQESVETVLELIHDNSLYKGEEWKTHLEEFLKYKKKYIELSTDRDKELFAWEQSAKVGPIVGKIKNHSIGVLLTSLSEGKELEDAVKQYEIVVAPANYKRPKAIFTKKMLEDAKNKIKQLGYMQSLGRRFATIDDITINNILFSNKDTQSRMNGDPIFSVFDEMEQEVAINPKKFSRVEEISIKDFVDKVLPTAESVELLFESKLSSNMVSLIAPKDINAPSMFKWNNPFSWAYAGNVTDSDIKRNVKLAGGSITGVLRFSIQWNDDQFDPNDLDAHCIEPNGFRIYFDTPYDNSTGGNLDIDIRWPDKGIPAVENITFPDVDRMRVGEYVFGVHQYAYRGGRNGFKAEIEFDGQIYKFEYNNMLRDDEFVEVARVEFDGEKFTIKEKLPSDMSVKKVWGVNTNQFVPVSAIMYSPNYWDKQNGIGHKHYFFMLKGCVNEEVPNGFYNEFLKNELIEHKRVLEALGSKMHVEDTDDQLSGIGFSSTKRNDTIVKVKDKSSNEKVLRIRF